MLEYVKHFMILLSNTLGCICTCHTRSKPKRKKNILMCILHLYHNAFHKTHDMHSRNITKCSSQTSSGANHHHGFEQKKLVVGEKNTNIHGIPRYMKSSMKYHKIMMTVIMHGYKLFVNLSPQAHTSIPQAHTSIHTCICAHLVNKYESRQCQRISIYIFNTLKMMSVSLIRIVFRRK